MDRYDYSSFNDDEEIQEVKVYDPTRKGHIKVLDLHLSINDLDALCRYVYNVTSTTINTAALTNVKILLNILNKKYYTNNDELMARIEFINNVLDARLNDNLDNKLLINTYVLRNCGESYKEIIQNEIIDDVLMTQIDESAARYYNKAIYEDLVTAYSKVYSKRLNKLLAKEENGDYPSIKDFTKEFKKLVNDMYEDMNDSEKFQSEGSEFDLSEETLSKKINNYVSKFKSPSNKLKTGLQYLNRMLNGGFESGRSYLFMGVTGIGKSIILLSIALWIVKFNKLPKTNGMKQMVLFISQENSELETLERIFNITVSGNDIRDSSADDIIEGLRKSGYLIPKNSKNGINFKFVYKSDKEIGVNDIDDMITEYEKDGISVVAVIQDYIEKLNPKYKSNELRTSLGNVATELSELAKKRNIPVISAAQLNRSAVTILDGAMSMGKKNVTKLLGKQNISESWDLMKNVDSAIIINREFSNYDNKEQQYLAFKLEKLRGRPSKDGLYCFLHPFDENNSILLESDVDKPMPISRLTIEEFNPMEERVRVGATTVFTDSDSGDSNFIKSVKDIVSDNFEIDEFDFDNINKIADNETKKMESQPSVISLIDIVEENSLKISKRLNIITDEDGRRIVKIGKRNC